MTAYASAQQSVARIGPATFNIVNKGTTTFTVSAPAPINNAENAVVECVMWRVTNGVLNALITVFVYVIDASSLLIIVNSPVAQALTIEVAGLLKEYLP